MDFGENDNRGEVLFSSPYIKSTYFQCYVTIDVNLDRLAEVVIVKFLPFHIVLFGNKSLQAAQWMNGEFCSTSLEGLFEYMYLLLHVLIYF